MKTTTADLRKHLDREVTSLCTCWRIERRDGKKYYYTDADHEVRVDGDVYASAGGYNRTAIETTATLSVDNLDVSGVASALALPLVELQSGLFDGAAVFIFLTNWRNPSAGILKMRRGWFGEVQLLPNGTFTVELRGLMQFLAHTYTGVYSETCSHDLGDSKCAVPIRPKPVKRGTAYAVSDRVTIAQTGEEYVNDRAGSITSPGRIYDLNPKDNAFDEITDFGTSEWWVSDGINVRNNPNPVYAGQPCFGGNGTGGVQTLEQVVDLLERGMDAARLDSGECRLDMVSARFGDGAGLGQIRVNAYDAAMQLNGLVAASGYTGLTSGVWEQVVNLRNTIPVGTRFIRIQYRVDSDPGVQARQFFDGVSVYATDPYEIVRDVSGPIFLEAVEAGTTAATRPTITSYDVGDLYYDGSVRWKVENGFLREGVVTYEGGRRNFRAKITEPRAAKGWFNGGTVTFLTGKNAGASMEVKAWNPDADDRVELFLSLPFDTKRGDVFTIYPGCDKSRICCAALFDNAANFGGHPDVPGRAGLFQTPDAK